VVVEDASHPHAPVRRQAIRRCGDVRCCDAIATAGR
jgi:hypothetical protein